MEIHDYVNYLLPSKGVEHGRRLIKNQHLRLYGEHTGNGYALLLSSRQHVRSRTRIAQHIHCFQGIVYAPMYFLGGHTKVFGPEAHILLDDRGDYLVVGILEYYPDLLSYIQRPALIRRVHAVHGHAPLVRNDKGVHELRHCGFSASVMTDDGNEFAVKNIEAYTLQRLSFGAVIGVFYILNTNHIDLLSQSDQPQNKQLIISALPEG